MAEQFPVTIAVTLSNGSRENVRVGTATKTAEGFSLELGALAIGGKPVAAPAYALAPSGGGGDGPVFPPYGRSKGMPVRGGSMQDLEYYANGCRRTLNDPSKSRWHDKEKVLLAAIEAEIARQGGGSGVGGGSGGEPPPPGDEDVPF